MTQRKIPTPEEIQAAWQKAQDAWEAAGKIIPCYEPRYMAAREELAAIHARCRRMSKVSRPNIDSEAK